MKSKDKKELTRAELQVMNILWDRAAEGGATSADVMGGYPEPKPAATTLLTFLKILTEKGFVSTEKQGKQLRFTPVVSRDDYMRHYMAGVKNTFFGGSLASLVSFFVRNEQMTDSQVDELLDIIQQKRGL